MWTFLARFKNSTTAAARDNQPVQENTLSIREQARATNLSTRIYVFDAAKLSLLWRHSKGRNECRGQTMCGCPAFIAATESPDGETTKASRNSFVAEQENKINRPSILLIMNEIFANHWMKCQLETPVRPCGRIVRRLFSWKHVPDSRRGFNSHLFHEIRAFNGI